jgi:hypothetical protein
MRTNSEQTKEESEELKQRSRRLRGATEELVKLIDQARELTPEESARELEETLRMPSKGSKRSH